MPRSVVAVNRHDPTYYANFAGHPWHTAVRYLVPFILKRPGKVDRW